MENFIGQIALFPYKYAPQGWAECAGQNLAIRDNMALFYLIGTTFGGDGKNTFSLPNMKGKEPVHGMAYYIALKGTFPQQ